MKYVHIDFDVERFDGAHQVQGCDDNRLSFDSH